MLSYVYQIPSVYRFSSMHWMPSRVSDGWQISGITTFQSGFPLDVVDSSLPSLQANDLTFYCTFGVACWDVPNVTGPIVYENPKTTANNMWFSPSAFSSAPWAPKEMQAAISCVGPASTISTLRS